MYNQVSQCVIKEFACSIITHNGMEEFPTLEHSWEISYVQPLINRISSAVVKIDYFHLKNEDHSIKTKKKN